MKIYSVRYGFSADHSSSSYHFYAVNKLKPEQMAAIAHLTRQQPTGRELAFHYPGETGIPSAWPDKLLTLGYDVEISESYDWWGADLSLPYKQELYSRIACYECESDANGLGVRRLGDRMIVGFGFSMDYGAAYGAFGSNPFRGLGRLFKEIREELLAGNLGAIRVMYDQYGPGEPLEDEAAGELSENARQLQNVITSY